MKQQTSFAMGGVISYPTRCLYGLGADAINHSAVQRIYNIKNRPKNKPILLLVADPEDVASLVENVPRSARMIMTGFWPGQVTIVFNASHKVLPVLTGGTGKIGIRAAGHPVAARLVKRIGRPITGTSANISGSKASDQSPGADSIIADRVDLLLDTGPLKGGIGSTVVDVTQDPPVVVREGIIPAVDIFRLFEIHTGSAF